MPKVSQGMEGKEKELSEQKKWGVREDERMQIGRAAAPGSGFTGNRQMAVWGYDGGQNYAPRLVNPKSLW